MSAVAVLPILLAVLVVPAVPLVPMEIWLIRVFGKFTIRQAVRVYLYCLPAKIVAFFFTANVAANSVGYGTATQRLWTAIVSTELCYSLMHFLISFQIIRSFTVRGKPLWLMALCISTIIPWLWSAGVYCLVQYFF